MAKPTRDGSLEPTMVMLTPEQRRWLRHRAVDRAAEVGGKPDGSAIIRELLDRAMKRGRAASRSD
jgi:hypothetical protein